MLNIHTVQQSSTIEANTVHRKKSAIVQNVLVLSLKLQDYNPHQRLTLRLSNYTTLFSVSEGRGHTNTPSGSWEERRSDAERLRPSEETFTPTTEEEPAQRGLHTPPALKAGLRPGCPPPDRTKRGVTKSQRVKVL